MNRFPIANPLLRAGFLARRSILLAGGDDGHREPLREKLVNLGAACFAVNSAAEAVASATGRTFDAIVLDIDSETGGAEAVRRIRMIPTQPPGPALVAILTQNVVGAAAWAAETGFDGFLKRRDALARAPLLLSLLLAPSSVGTTELNDIQQENQDDEGADSEERGHEASPDFKTSGAL